MHCLSDAIYIHRDLKLTNIMIYDHLCPQIIDFDMSSMVKDGQRYNEEAINGIRIGPLPFWHAPEVTTKLYSKASDVWSFGIIAYQIVTNQVYPPYEDLQFWTFAEYQFACELLESSLKNHNRFNSAFTDLIVRMLSVQPFDRPTFIEIYNKMSIIIVKREEICAEIDKLGSIRDKVNLEDLFRSVDWSRIPKSRLIQDQFNTFKVQYLDQTEKNKYKDFIVDEATFKIFLLSIFIYFLPVLLSLYNF